MRTNRFGIIAIASKLQPLTLPSLALASLLLPATANAELTESQRAQLSQIWQEEFPAPELLGDPFLPTPNGPQPHPQRPAAVAQPYSPYAHLRSDQPHPAVARIEVPEKGAISFGSGTLVDVRDQFGLVITNWHVVRDAKGPIEVHFPGGFRSKARALKVDADWDLAALVIWRPPVRPVEMSSVAPRPGDQLTICGYGQGAYRSATGRCTQYYAPRSNFPQEMVELNVEARQGDSGGPIFNRQGQLAGVLFGAGQGTTLGSFGGRVENFLASLAPNIGGADETVVAAAAPAPPSQPPQDSRRQVICRDGVCYPVESTPPEAGPSEKPELDNDWDAPTPQLAGMWAAEDNEKRASTADHQSDAQLVSAPTVDSDGWRAEPGYTWFAQIKTALAAVGLITVCMFLLKAVC